MVAATYGIAGPATAKTGKGVFARVLDAIAETQSKRAERELDRYRHLLPHDFAPQRYALWSRSEDEPFGGW